jgi:excisionase family DNA binding protein
MRDPALARGISRHSRREKAFDMQSETILAYTIAGACRAAGVGRTKLYSLISEGEIEARRCGSRTLVPAESLRAFIARLPTAPIQKSGLTASCEQPARKGGEWEDSPPGLTASRVGAASKRQKRERAGG